MDTKSSIRKKAIEIRNNLCPEDVEAKSGKIIEKLKGLDEYKNAGTVFTYISFKNEVSTLSLIDDMLKSGKRVIVPYTDTVNTAIIPTEIKNLGDLKRCSFGYLEPKSGQYEDPSGFDLIIVPGVAFDKNLNRIGFGKGYYDRILCKRKKDVKAAAIAYEFQVMDEIPSEPHDVKMDMIITEENIYN
jgi:5-formyltetrahydrofolate cyclo-ligase